MADQDEIDKQAHLWLVAQRGNATEDPNDIFERWEQFVASHDHETAEALRRSAYFEAFRLLDAFTAGIVKELQTGTQLDKRIIEHIRHGGSRSFKGDREKVRFYVSTAVANREELLQRFRRK
ncbi:hypothetical protein [uncultured Microbacterium sp.]|uniref:hypothetical protein n=1 Tax=uncultured Microbacterium sp. TaxID=191216 RepID=UPI0030F559E3